MSRPPNPTSATVRRLPGGLGRRGVAALLLLVGILALLGLHVSPAHAHAVLEEATPSDRSVLDAPPDEVSLRFNEPVTLPSGGLRVFDADASRVDDGTVDTDGPETIAVALPDDLPEGGYVVTWRVISADSHPVGGVFTFTIGDAPEVDDAVVAELFAGDDPLVGILGPGLRAVAYAGVLLAAGALFSALVVTRRREDRARIRGFARTGALVGIGATLAAVPIQVMGVTGEGPLATFRPEVIRELVASSFGQSTIVRLVWLAVLLLFLLRRAPLTASVIAGGAATLSFVLDGHQRSSEPVALLAASDAVHLLAAALWFGGLVVVAWLVRSRRLDDDPVGAATVVARFSGAALWSVLLVAVSGAAMTWALVRAPRALTGTDYGTLLLVKIGLVLLVIAVAAYNRFRLVPAIAQRVAVPAGSSRDDAGSVETTMPNDPTTSDQPQHDETPVAPTNRARAAWRQLRSTLVVEVVLITAVLGVTGVLVTTQPAAEEAGVTGAAQVVTPLTDDLDVEVILDPNEVGLNAIHIYVLDETGRPAADVEELVLDLRYVPEDIGPFRTELFFVGTGHWTANVDTFRFPGEWEIEVVAGIDRFTEARATVTINVNP